MLIYYYYKMSNTINFYSKGKKDGKLNLFPLFTDEQKEHQLKLKQINDEKKKLKKNKIAVDTQLPIISKSTLPKEVSENYKKREIQIINWLNKHNIKDTPENRKNYDSLIGSGVKLLGFEKGKYPKKYNAILEENGKQKKIGFGHQNYEQYKDSTGLNLYTDLNHLDTKRRDLYYKRHNKNYPKYSADYFSKKYLW